MISSRTPTSYDESRCMLVELLADDDDPPILGMDELSPSDLRFLQTTCAAEVMLHTICCIARFNKAEALKGLAALKLEERLREICP